MSDISKVKLSDGEIYEFKDLEARRILKELLGDPVQEDQEPSDIKD